jgi:molecular chaperone GrpE
MAEKKHSVHKKAAENELVEGESAGQAGLDDIGMIKAELVEGILEEGIEAEEVEALRQQLEESQVKADEYLEGWQRALAEFANYKKRVEKEQAQSYQIAAGSVLRRYLVVVDDLERALKNRPQAGEGAAWAEGIELIYRKLLGILEAEGVTQIDPQGEMFDPNFHEAVISEASHQFESGRIIEVLQKGYLQGERVLRPALVRVAS